MSTNNGENRNAVFNQQTEGSVAGQMLPKKNVMLEDFGYEVPVDLVPLPSGGVTYSVNSVLHGAESLEVRAMTAKEEDILTSRALLKKGTVITHLLNNCIVTPGVNADMLLSGDRNALMIALRITGYGADYKANVACPSCGQKSEQNFNLSELEIKKMGIEPVQPGENVFEFKLPITGKTVKFKFLTGRDEQEMLKAQERMKKISAGNQKLITQKLQACVLSVDGISQKSKLDMFIQNMPAGDSRALRTYIDDNEPGVDMSVWMDCPHCLETSTLRLPIGPRFFWPDT